MENNNLYTRAFTQEREYLTRELQEKLLPGFRTPADNLPDAPVGCEPTAEDEVPSLDEWSDDTDDPDLFQADE